MSYLNISPMTGIEPPPPCSNEKGGGSERPRSSCREPCCSCYRHAPSAVCLPSTAYPSAWERYCMSFAATYCCRLCSAAVPTETTNRGGSFWSYPSGGGQSPYLLLEDSCRAGCHCITKPHMRLEQSGLMAPRTIIYRLIIKKV